MQLIECCNNFGVGVDKTLWTCYTGVLLKYNRAIEGVLRLVDEDFFER
jgi:hypothetical protein